MKILRGDLYWCDLYDAEGSEQRGERPVLVIQNDVGNEKSPTVIVAAVTYGTKKNTHTHVYVNPHESGLLHKSTILLEQIRTIDKKRLRDYIGHLSHDKMTWVDRALSVSVGLIPFEIRGGMKSAQ